MKPADAPHLRIESIAQWRAWLAEHHADADPGVWLEWRRRTSHPEALDYDEVAMEALSFGWIDGHAKSIDTEWSMLWVTRRRRDSWWSRLSKERVARAESEGRMTDAGRAVIEAAKADGSWSRGDAVEALVVPDDLAAALAEHPGAREAYDGFAPSTRKQILQWIVVAKRDETRARRVEETARLAAEGRPAQ
ncbi:uncharacterized protein YdeI (YjbR/CyaY-like superfamily) [Mumia flava]|uniref:Uncharacterized protein YdeI (YjbR/CyaY-like superfamily) n=1 Tax=Mumia flava TaxID=1348852 RepID=A0A0B2B325_9ACTN|nr:YdeI/OmpD-associated family protein [Mumia flava]PJJ57860.1 uncharacterized protein YdeI (YjbR/CyaY-like superfamily) [Mumia flava]